MVQQQPVGTSPTTTEPTGLSAEDSGYQKSLRPRQIQMIAIGGAIGTGLFLGAGSRLHSAGPMLFIDYAVCGVFVFFVLRALGELVLHRPSSGSFVSYSREFFGERTAFVAGWMYFMHWAMTSVVDVTAIATYVHYWGAFAVIPQWTIALIALVIVLSMNLISVKLFGELEFWASLVKVAALVVFLVVGIVYLAARVPVAGVATGPSVITDHGGPLPSGVLSLVLVVSGVVFAYASVELVGTAAGETENPRKIMPRAINSVIARIAVFYVGSLVLLALLVPAGAFSAKESPFVTFFARIGLPGSGTIMNVVVITAALSSLNAGLYSTGRITRSMAANGSAPGFLNRMSGNGVPYGGIVLTSCITLLGVGLNAVVPDEAFEIVLNMSALGTITAWSLIVLCHLQLVRRWRAGTIDRPTFRMPGAPWTNYATLVFLAVVLVLTAFDYPVGTWTVATIAVIVPALVGGWFLVRRRVRAVAAERSGWTGTFPVVAARPPWQVEDPAGASPPADDHDPTRARPGTTDEDGRSDR